MNKNIIIGLTIIITIVTFLCIFAYGEIIHPVPQQTIEQAASAYLNAVQQQDLRTLNQLCFPENNDCSTDMPDRLKMYAGFKLHDIHISYLDSPSAFYWVIKIQAKGTNNRDETIDINDSFSLRKREQNPAIPDFLRDRRWYITVSPKNPHPLPSNAAPASISTPTPSAYPDPRSYSPQSYPFPSP